MKKIIIVTALFLSTLALFAQGTIQINVANLKNNEGQLIVKIFKKGTDFGVDKEPFREINYSSISDNKASISIENIEKGVYAFLIYHDEDKNEVCRTNWFGMPKEGVGKSGEHGSRPSFSNSQFSFNGTHEVFNIKLKYL